MNTAGVRGAAVFMYNQMAGNPAYRGSTSAGPVDVELARTGDAITLRIVSRNLPIDSQSAGFLAAMFGCPPSAKEEHSQERRRSLVSNQWITDNVVTFTWSESFEVA